MQPMPWAAQRRVRRVLDCLHACYSTVTRQLLDCYTPVPVAASMHDRSRGLHYSADEREWAVRNGDDDMVDVGLTAHALLIVRQLRLGGVALPSPLRAMEPEWRGALGRGLAAQV